VRFSGMRLGGEIVTTFALLTLRIGPPSMGFSRGRWTRNTFPPTSRPSAYEATSEEVS